MCATFETPRYGFLIRVFGRTGQVLADHFHHLVKRTPTEVRRALAYVLLNVRKHFWQRRRAGAPVVLAGWG